MEPDRNITPFKSQLASKAMMTGKYRGIKVRGLDQWLWFLTSRIATVEDHFMATQGWADSGAGCPDIDIPVDLIEGSIWSDTLLHNE